MLCNEVLKMLKGYDLLPIFVKEGDELLKAKYLYIADSTIFIFADKKDTDGIDNSGLISNGFLKFLENEANDTCWDSDIELEGNDIEELSSDELYDLRYELLVNHLPLMVYHGNFNECPFNNKDFIKPINNIEIIDNSLILNLN